MATVTRLDVRPIDTGFVLKDKIHDALKEAIARKNIYAETEAGAPVNGRLTMPR